MVNTDSEKLYTVTVTRNFTGEQPEDTDIDSDMNLEQAESLYKKLCDEYRDKATKRVRRFSNTKIELWYPDETVDYFKSVVVKEAIFISPW